MNPRALVQGLRVVRDLAPWRPGHVALAAEQVVHLRRNEHAGRSDLEHLQAVAAWIGRAQDASADGGVIGRYDLRHGWSSSYPETTGYLVPTMLALATSLDEAGWVERARRAIGFLLGVQLPTGAFPGGEVQHNRERASVFNSAQILNGLQAWHAATGDERVLDAAHRTARWLCEVQDADGAYRRHIYNDLVTTYTTHASCWLADFGAYTGERSYVASAHKHLRWALTHRDRATGWIDLMGFFPEDHRQRRGVTHTIAYTLWGILKTAEVAGDAEGIDAVTQAAVAIARRVELSGWLPGVLDRDWQGCASYACLTGNAQMALIFLRLHETAGDPRFLSVALKLVDLVKRTQPMTNPDAGVRGGIPGSSPVWGGYLYGAFPNWAAKFFVDALLASERSVARVPARVTWPSEPPRPMPDRVRDAAVTAGTAPIRVVLLASPRSHKVAQICERWSTWGFRPAVVVVERRPEPSLPRRALARLREDGLAPFARRLSRNREAQVPARVKDDAEGWTQDVVAYCTEKQIPVLEVASLAAPDAIAAMRALQADLHVLAGAGILRAPTLAIPRLGTLNAHMGRLPWFRGMNVAEWSVFGRVVPACTVHLVDPGVDTGDILCVRDVDISGAASLVEVRRRVDEVQIQLLGEVVASVVRTGALPERHAQASAEGRQFFRMHPRLRAEMDAELKRGAAASPSAAS